jgi:hypothetical protein
VEASPHLSEMGRFRPAEKTKYFSAIKQNSVCLRLQVFSWIDKKAEAVVQGESFHEGICSQAPFGSLHKLPAPLHMFDQASRFLWSRANIAMN